MKVQQELMRHASIQTTMNVYGQAMTNSKRHANSQVVSLVFGVPTRPSKGLSQSSKFGEFWGRFRMDGVLLEGTTQPQRIESFGCRGWI